MRVQRGVIWGAAALAVGVLLVLEYADVYASWVVVGPICLGVAGVALLLDQLVCAPTRKWGFFASLLMIGLSAGTVLQDAELVVDAWAVWPFVAGALLLGGALEAWAAGVRHKRSARHRASHHREPRHAAPA